MRSIILISVLCLLVGWSNGASTGAGAFTYGNSAGNRYGGTYNGLNEDHVFRGFGFFPPVMPNFWSDDDFFPEYFNNLQIVLREAFKSNFENQKRAYTAARKAYDLTYNQAGYIPNLTTRFFDRPSFGGLGDFGIKMGDKPNSAFAGGAVGPGFTHQVAAINPKNPHVSNVNVMNRFADTGKNKDNGGFYSVQSSSFVTSSNVDGKEKTHRKAETVVNRNGQVTQYKVED